MDIANLFLFCLISCVIGAVIMLIVQYYIFVKYFQMKPEEIEKLEGQNAGSKNQKYILPQSLVDNMKCTDGDGTIMSVNLILQFLFFELRYSNKVRKWFDRKLSLELDELISKTTTGKLFDKLSIRDLDLGNQFPEIKNLRVADVQLHEKEGHIESLDVMLDLEYNGNFKLSIDADMVLGKKGFLSVKVKHISGPVRLQFTRSPFSHWSLGFVREPTVDLAIESQIQGRQMQSNVTTLISNQIKKAIRRKHTLPNYKLRFKPFFQRLIYEDNEYIQPNGTLEINIRELTRLSAKTSITHVYCTLTLSTYQWVTARQHDDKNLIISIDIEIHKAKNQQIGIVFKQTDQVIVETVIPNTPAAKAKLKRGDRCVAIEGKSLNHINQVAKILKNLNKSVFMLRVERTIAGIIKNDAVLEDFADVYEDFNTVNISFSKNSDSVQIGANNPEPSSSRSNSKDRTTGMNSSSESSNNTPSNSPRKLIDKTKSIIRKNSEPKSLTSTPSDGSIKKVDSKSVLSKNNEFDFPQHSTVDCDFSDFIRMNDSSLFNLSENFNFINVNVFGRSQKSGENLLLGYLNIPLNGVLTECSESNLYIEKYNLIPPEIPDLSNHPLSSQSGFTSQICFGDILISFIWNGENTKVASPLATEDPFRPKLISEGSLDSTDKIDIVINKQHDFIRTHFHRATQCDFCLKKIWLKDAYQCRNCAMCCHKKCITKCQNSTICGATDIPSAANSITSLIDDQQSISQPEFLVTSANGDEEVDEEPPEEPDRSKLETHRQSFSNLLAQGIKRVNSANNLAIPNIVSSLTNQSKSLPPTPQHTPRKQSLVIQHTNPFELVIHKLEQVPIDKKVMTCDEIKNITEPLTSYGTSLDDLMELAKSSSENLYNELEAVERIDKINLLLSKLRIALDSETLFQQKVNERPSSTKSDLTPNSQIESVQKTFMNGQSEERIQVLSVIMLHLCSGLQSAQGDIK